MIGLLGKKIGQTRIYDTKGNCVPVTVVQAGPNRVLQCKTAEKDGYSAVQLGFDEQKEQRLSRPVAKAQMTQILLDGAPSSIGGETVTNILTTDGVKYLLEDDSWLLIRPSGTEPVLRVYAEGRSANMVKALIGYGEQVAKTVV